MIQSRITDIETLTSNTGTVSFDVDCLRTRSANCCGWLQHTQASPLYKLVEGGIYEISFNADVSSATAGVVALGLYIDGQLVTETTSAKTLATAGDYANIGFNKLIRVCCRANSTITVGSVGSVPTPTDSTTSITTQIPIIVTANLIITKIA